VWGTLEFKPKEGYLRAAKKKSVWSKKASGQGDVPLRRDSDKYFAGKTNARSSYEGAIEFTHCKKKQRRTSHQVLRLGPKHRIRDGAIWLDEARVELSEMKKRGNGWLARHAAKGWP